MSKKATTGPFTLASELRWLSANTHDQLPLGSSDPNDHASELYTYLDSARRRLWFYRSALLFLRAILLIALSVLALKILRLLGLAIPEMTDQLVAVGVAIWTLVLITQQRLRYFDVARVVDRNLELRAQLGTAVELIQKNSTGQLSAPQIRSATERIRTLPAREMIRFRWPVRDLRVLGVSIVLFGLLTLTADLGIVPALTPGAATGVESALLPSDSPEQPQWSELNAAEIAQMQQTLQSSSNMEDLVTELNELLQSNAISPEEYAARLAEAEAEIRQRAEASANAQSALGELANALRDSSATREVAEALNRGDYQGAAQALSELGTQTDQLSPQARQELANALRDASQRTQDLNSDIAQQSQQAADALQSGNPQAAQAALNNLSNAVAQTSQAIAPQSELGQSLSELQANSGTLGSENGAPGSEMNQPSGQPQAGTDAAQAPGSGGENGQGGADTQGQLSGGGDDTAQQRTTGSGGGSGASSQPSSSDPGGETPLGVDARGQTLRLQGKPSDQGASQRGEGSGETPRTESANGVLSANGAAIERSDQPGDAYGEKNYVPIELRSRVRDFFSKSASR